MTAPFVNGNVYVRFGGAAGIAGLVKGCQKCCRDKGFWENCAKPVATVLKQAMQAHDDAAFNDHYDDHINNQNPITGAWRENPHTKPLPPKKNKPVVNDNRPPSSGPYDSQGTQYWGGF